ncbi:hypothetical protein PIIN_00938 [Serendipita indica DSM 11827]|uniref:Uncharacterized protein n=1 Tax=Serendipita indica (strain DSM 11827) TaxID=1109443 RepID=G4T6Y7_SERID|nr:hypothetical protein PIIN_00938 [Serendipita indica DSM 11827]
MPPHHSAELRATHADFSDAVDKYIASYLSTLHSAMVMSALLAFVSTVFFVDIQSQISATPTRLASLGSHKIDALQALTYLAIICNCNAAILSFLLSDRLSTPPLAFSQSIVDSTDSEETTYDVYAVLKKRIPWRLWSPFKLYWLFCMLIGVLSVIVEFALYVWLQENHKAIKIAVTTFASVGSLPLLIFISEKLTSLRKHDYAL